MKVLFLSNLPSPYRVEFFSELGKKCELTVVFEREKASDRAAEWVAQAQPSYKQVFLHGIRVKEDTALSISIIKFLKQKYDVIVIGMYSTPTAMLAIAYLKLHRIPFILSTDGGFIADERALKRIIKTSLIGSAQMWLSPSQLADDYLIHYGAITDHIKRYAFTSLAPGEIRTDEINNTEKFRLREQLGMGDFLGKVIISVGRPLKGKGYDKLIEAIQLLDDSEIQLWLIGAPRKEYENVIGFEFPSFVRAVDFADKLTLWDYYYAADVFALATQYDVWGLVVNEAMANSLPIITTDRCGAGDALVSNGVNGYVVSHDSVDELCKKLSMVINNSREMGSESRKIIADFTYRNMVDDHMEAFNQFVSRN